MTELANVIEIAAPEVDKEEILARIQKRMLRRRAEAEARGLDYEQLVKDSVHDFSSVVSLDLYIARKRADDIQVPVSLEKSTVPILGSVLDRVRLELHRLAMYYVNLLAERQVVFNLATTDILAELIGELGAREVQLTELRSETANLRQRLGALEARLTDRS